jgi:hypothetical protein
MLHAEGVKCNSQGQARSASPLEKAIFFFHQLAREAGGRRQYHLRDWIVEAWFVRKQPGRDPALTKTATPVGHDRFGQAL